MKKTDRSLFNTVQDDRIVRIYLILGCLGFAGAYLVYYFIKHDMPASDLIVVMTTDIQYAFFIYLLLALLILELFFLLRYKKMQQDHAERDILHREGFAGRPRTDRTEGTRCRHRLVGV